MGFFLLRRHRGIEASRHRGKAEEKTSADYADYADKRMRRKRTAIGWELTRIRIRGRRKSQPQIAQIRADYLRGFKRKGREEFTLMYRMDWIRI